MNDTTVNETTTDPHGAAGLPAADEVRLAWHRFVAAYEPLRPALYGYCRGLTRNAFDAEDLVQDALMRAFSTAGSVYPELKNPRAWLFRVASNLFIDRARRAGRSVPLAEHSQDPGARDSASEAAGAASDGGRILFEHLAPRERAAVVLKDVFELSLEEIAETLTTTVGAVKSALHRGRGKLSEVPMESVPNGTSPKPPAAVEAFCKAFNDRDLEGLTGLLLEEATSDMVGMCGEVGRDTMGDRQTGSLYHTLHSPLSHAVFPELLVGNLDDPRSELREVLGETVLLIFYDHDDGPVLRDVWRLQPAEDDSAIERLFFYFFCPEVLADVAKELGLDWRSNGYRYTLSGV